MADAATEMAMVSISFERVRKIAAGMVSCCDAFEKDYVARATYEDCPLTWEELEGFIESTGRMSHVYPDMVGSMREVTDHLERLCLENFGAA